MSYGNPDLKSRFFRCQTKVSLSTGANNGTGFPREGFTHAFCVVDLGTLGTAATVDVKWQESDALASGYTDIAPGVHRQAVKASDDNVILTGSLNLWGKKAFIRPVVTVGAAASVVGVYAIASGPDRDERVTAVQYASGAVSGPNTEADRSFTGA